MSGLEYIGRNRKWTRLQRLYTSGVEIQDITMTIVEGAMLHTALQALGDWRR